VSRALSLSFVLMVALGGCTRGSGRPSSTRHPGESSEAAAAGSGYGVGLSRRNFLFAEKPTEPTTPSDIVAAGPEGIPTGGTNPKPRNALTVIRHRSR